jgi:predicted 2-oxoglutarate/Fe(II)-dependent dioxygenase YbiX
MEEVEQRKEQLPRAPKISDAGAVAESLSNARLSAVEGHARNGFFEVPTCLNGYFRRTSPLINCYQSEHDFFGNHIDNAIQSVRCPTSTRR